MEELVEIDKVFEDLNCLLHGAAESAPGIIRTKIISYSSDFNGALCLDGTREKNNIARRKAAESAKVNEDRHRNGRRYDSELMSYCTYLLISGGAKTYRTMKLNDDDALPSIKGVEKSIEKKRCTITEGQLRHLELAAYLKSLKVDTFVSLSEDATNVIGVAEYSRKLNQIVGFVPPSCPDTGMPIPSTFAATSATAMESILADPNKSVSNMVNVVMAQPLAMKTPAFCLLVYGGNGSFTSINVAKRWAFIVKELANVGIKVVSFASDSDPRYNATMKDLMLNNPTDASSPFPVWFGFDLCTADYLPLQDTVHIGTKMRNRVLCNNCKLIFGDHSISKNHFQTLIDTISRDKHGLYQSHIRNNDRMNFGSVQKMTDSRVLEALKQHVDGSAGTILYMKMIDMILRAFLDFSLTPLMRIRNMWYAVFILRIWKEFIKRHPHQDKDNFITIYTYICIEVNAHSLVSLIIYLKANRLEHLFFPHLMSSQPCESFFREFRSLSSVGSTFTNTSVLGMMQRCERIALMNEISRIELKNFTFVTDNKRSREIYYKTNVAGYNKTVPLPSIEEIIKEIERAKDNAIEDAAMLGVEIEQPFNFTCDIHPTASKTKSQKIKQNTLNSLPREDSSRLTKFKGLHLKDYTNKIDPNTFDEKSTYVAVDDDSLDGTGERRIYVRKSALCKVYMDDRTKLSSDRLVRVKQRVTPAPDLNKHSEVLKIFMKTNYDENSDESSDESWVAFQGDLDGWESSSDESSGHLTESEESDVDLNECFQSINFN